ncbi:cleavage polyadenylation factor subunit fip1 [Rhizophlyctis rosea]|uniref:Cleavage polyadenylation factor subunit fip1 n=1 Tax=Rhizophlyctis rosea TaxID=64517 RepID=A0AAD5SIF2_9FUNG|nr:cleavage polyadenylation factor subunit fip1 [Rhizophlyctis rosea]
MDEVDEYLYGAEDDSDGLLNVVTIATTEAPQLSTTIEAQDQIVEDDTPYEPPEEPYEPPGFDDEPAEVLPAEDVTATGEYDEGEEQDEEEDEDEEEDDLEIITTAPAPGTSAPPALKPLPERRNSLVNVPSTTTPTAFPHPPESKLPASISATQSPYTFIAPVPRQDGTVAPPALPATITKPVVDIEVTAQIDEKAIYDVDLESLEDKPWRRPGSDITDYFNYGFNEQTWTAYCAKQKRLREGPNVGTQELEFAGSEQGLGAAGQNFPRPHRPQTYTPTQQTRATLPLKRSRDQDDSVIEIGGEGEMEGAPDGGIPGGFPPDDLGPEFHGGPPPPMFGGPVIPSINNHLAKIADAEIDFHQEMFGPIPPFMPPEMGGPGFDPYRRGPPMPPMRPGMMRPGMAPPMRGDRPFYPMDEPPIPPFGRDGPPHRGGPPPFDRGPPHGRDDFPPFGEPGPGRLHDRPYQDRSPFDREREWRGGPESEDREA